MTSRNFITTVALLMHPKLRGHVTTMFVLSLCVSDLLFCSINLPLTASRYVKERWDFGDQLCQMFAFVFYGNEAVSLLSMVAITINRYILIAYYDMYSQIYTTTKIWVQLFLVWLVSFGLMVPPLLGIWGRLGLDTETFSCTILRNHGRSPKKYLFVFGFALPCVVIIVSYSCIYWKVRQSKRKLEGRSKLSGQTAKEKEEDSRLTTLMLTIFLCFLACFLPLMIMNVADDGIKYPWLHIIASILAWASSVINPLIYAATNRQYRAAYGNLLKFCQNNPVTRRTTWGSRTVGHSSNSPHYAEKRNPLKPEMPTKL
ncbi:unnamed protein product [Plutella xylostella]|uniref:(diamondback moth) hypothetical protein n=1 Tax=Plutella xylostella TaxID=51655 RepID=A0A8S4D234_PLUXY|nr:unnamed protein product [Plutella xylostella]